MTKKAEWIAQGAPAQLTDFLDAAVAQMHTKAVENDYLHKGKDVNAEDVDPVAAGMSDILDVSAAVSADEESIEKDAGEGTEVEGDVATQEVAADSETNEPEADGDEENGEGQPEDDNAVSTLQKSIEDMLTASLQAYHEIVVVPLQERLVELESVTKDSGAQAEDLLSSVALLPPAHAAANIKKAFSAPSPDTGNTEATEKELGDAVTNVADEDEDLAPTSTVKASENLLTGF